ncbi:hypothetical protein [Stomatohabitans albus]|uniref:hypothetical protein n=1 Tax=Stomatohabitans albus TaxID=3110766 RepID=UPI00300C4631
MAAFYRSLPAWFSGLILLTGCARAGGEPAQYTANGGLHVDRSHTVSQTVNPAGGQVQAVDVLVLDQPTEGDGVLNLALAAEGDVLAEQAVPLENITEPDRWVSFAFDQPVAVPDVVDVQLTIKGEGSVLVAANHTPDDAKPSNEPVHDPYPQGEAMANGKPINGDIAFRIVGTTGPSGLPGQVGAIAKEGTKRLIGQPLFAYTWGLVGMGAVCLAAWAFYTSRKS